MPHRCIAIQGCGTVVGHSLQMLERNASDFTETCPIFRSRDIRSHFDPLISDDGDYFSTCGSCRWSSHVDIDDEENAYSVGYVSSSKPFDLSTSDP